MKITVITVVFNAQDHLEDTIKSIIEQTYENLEYIIIDGNSTDNTVDIIRKYEQYISYWVSERDKGIYDAMNKAIDKASGEYINFLNAGDKFSDKDTISKVINSINESIDLVYGDYNLVKNENHIYTRSKDIGNYFRGMPFCHQSLFTKTSIMKKYKFDLSYSISADYDFILKSYVNNYRFMYLRFPISSYLSDGFSDNNAVKRSIEALRVISKYTNDVSVIYDSDPYKTIKNEQKINSYDFSILINKFYEKIKKLELDKKKLILYGYGHIGKMIYQEYNENIEAIVDKNDFNLQKGTNLLIHHPKDLKGMVFDYIVISVLGREEEIIKYISEDLMIAKKKIITIDF